MNTIAFITGANKGLGYETARRLTGLGHTVVLGARNPELGQDAANRLTGDDAALVFATNAVSIVGVTNAFLPLLGRSDAPAVINVSSGWAPSHAADPGYTAADLNGHHGTQTVTEGTDAIVTLATEDPSAGTGRFSPVAW